ncbi:V-type ATP synthase subunit C [Clostridioides difficile]|uniref:V-type ATP synthase subunit C n=1 Tax=Clostridioides difficile TaxID=1496 RepID=A0A9P4DBG0_CLODI|nr:V-type ATP synthase subunit C [Clostridioides difficile]AWH78594.1 V-type ATP synthase subunit C [Clostridioides difficile]AWH82419.1 V-type ATP synthase subunit C [Clostridioides difficile]AXU47507.1 V-type ATP synthase subunit C [Clostridioides difficile]AXU65641.1 V-type ATP synthase subunit C [Clostridioides difficile]EGT2213856.1 V-type ATP synthase subunit C [Clostridioides difficile]
MAEEKTYPYAVARIRVLEKQLLNRQMFIQMAEAKSPEDSLRIIAEAGYADTSNNNIHNFENILTQELSKTYEILKSLAPEEKFVDVFLYKNDYHNLKVLIKEEISGVDGEKYLIDGGTIPLIKLRESLANRSFSDLPKIMSSAILEAFDVYSKTQNGQMVDIVLDKATFTSMKETAKESQNKFVIDYVMKVCDLTNLKSFIRVKNMKKDFDMFMNVFVSGGSLDKEKFLEAFSSDTPASCFKSTSYSDVCKNGMDSGFTVFEKLCDDYLMEYVRGAKFKPLTLEPLIAYLYAKESEIKTIRIILTSKLNNIDADTIKERLRDAYV